MSDRILCQVCYHEPAAKFFKTETRSHAWCDQCITSSGFRRKPYIKLSYLTYEEYVVYEIMQS
jgi:hypothetical protein